jgi:hypothetical protein
LALVGRAFLQPGASSKRPNTSASSKSSNGTVSITTVALTGHGRTALDAYTRALRDLLGGL